MLALGAAGCSSEPSHTADTAPSDTTPDSAEVSRDDVDPGDAPDQDSDDGAAPDSAVDTAPDTLPDTAIDDAPLPDTQPDSAGPEVVADGSAEVDAGPSGCLAGELVFVDLPEASGAVALDADHDLLVADSGHSGRALVLDRALGVSATLVLPLGDGAGDDIEGLSLGPSAAGATNNEALGVSVWGLSSSGYLRAWRVQHVDGAWTAALVHGPVPIAEPGEWVGGPNAVNAGGNFEGICLHPAPTPGDCAGWAASKARGELVCVRAEGDGFRLDPGLRLPVFEAEHLSDCAFEPEPPHRLFAAGNVYSGDRVIEVTTLASSAAPIDGLPELAGAPNQEAILVRNLPESLEIQSFGDWQDLAGDRSPRVVFTCKP